MNKPIMINYDKEERILKLLGYHIKYSSNHTYLSILDEAEQEVGKIIIDQSDIETPIPERTILDYETCIEKDGIKYVMNIKRNGLGEELSKMPNNYNIDVIKGEEKTDSINIGLNTYPFINLRHYENDKSYDTNFSIRNQGFQLYMEGKTQNYNTLETIGYVNDSSLHGEKQYSYTIEYAKKDVDEKDYDSYRVITRNITATEKHEKIKLENATWRGNIKVKDEPYILDGKIEDVALKNEMGIDSFNHFRYRLNTTLPLCGDVLTALISKETIEENNLSRIIEREEKVYGIYHTIEDYEELDKLSEYQIYKKIAVLNGILNYELPNAANPWNKDAQKLETETIYNLDYLVYYTRRFGVEFEMEPMKGYRIGRPSSFDDWYKFWKNFSNNLSDKEFNKIVTLEQAGKDVSEYLPKTNWKSLNNNKKHI